MNVCEVSLSDASEEEDKTKKKSNRKTSNMWNFFTALDSDYALCNYCNQKFSYRTSTSNLRKHIICKHVSAVPLGDSSIKLSDESRVSTQSSDQLHESPPVERIMIKKENVHRDKRLESLKRACSFSETNHKNSWSTPRGRETDEYDAYGITVAAKLRKMEEKQRLFCERIINDALFKGALEQLTPLSEIVICIATSTHSG